MELQFFHQIKSWKTKLEALKIIMETQYHNIMDSRGPPLFDHYLL